MFDVGFTEVFLIGIVSLVVIGPERLPAVARTLGLWVGKLQRFVRGVKTDFASELESGDLKKLIGDQREQIDELRTMVSSAKKEFQQTSQSVVKSTREGLSELETSVKEAKEDVSEIGDVSADSSSNGETSTPSDESAATVSIEKATTQTQDQASLPDQSDGDSLKRTGTTDSDKS